MQVFLSYSEADRAFARKLSSRLSEQGLDVYDPNDDLFPGDNWPLKIGKALQESKAMVVLLSPDSMKSEWVRSEIEYALGDHNYKGRLFPVLVRPTHKIPWILRDIQESLREFEVVSVTDPAKVGDAIATALKAENYPALRALLKRRKHKPAKAM